MAGGTAPCTLNAANEVAVHAFLDGRLRFLTSPAVIEDTLDGASGRPVHSFESLDEADARRARRVGRASWSRSAGRCSSRMSWRVLAFVGFAALIILHEAGHFAAAKAVGMRVERFSLFFGRCCSSSAAARPSTGSAPIPLGGYVKITGMNPREELPAEVVPRAYYNQPVWKRIVVILAGPAVNLVIAFLIMWVLFLANGQAAASRAGRGDRAGHARRRGAQARRPARLGRRRQRQPRPRCATQLGTHSCAGRAASTAARPRRPATHRRRARRQAA